MSGATVEVTVQVRLTVKEIAAAFCQLDDEEQTQFFVWVGGFMKQWGPGKLEAQCFNIGRHVNECGGCSSPWARDVIMAMANGAEYNNAKSADYRVDPVNQPENIR